MTLIRMRELVKRLSNGSPLVDIGYSVLLLTLEAVPMNFQC